MTVVLGAGTVAELVDTIIAARIAGTDEQQTLAANLSAQWRAAIAAQQRAAAAAAAQERASVSAPVPADPPPTGGYVPPANASAAQIAVGAAYSVIGAPYVFGAAGPDAFDCSGQGPRG